MGKAFTEEERLLVQEKLRRIGLKLFSEKGIKGVSIRELTSAVGIAQGGFYTFYADKTDFLVDLMECRIKEKLAVLKEQKKDSLNDPIKYISDIFYAEGMHLKENKAFDNMLSGSLEMFFNTEMHVRKRLGGLYKDYMTFMVKFWEENGYYVEIDENGFAAMLRAAGVLFSNAAFIGEEQFDRIYSIFCVSEVNAFLRVSK